MYKKRDIFDFVRLATREDHILRRVYDMPGWLLGLSTVASCKKRVNEVSCYSHITDGASPLYLLSPGILMTFVGILRCIYFP